MPPVPDMAKDQLLDIINSLPNEVLARIVLEQAINDPAFAQQLIMAGTRVAISTETYDILRQSLTDAVGGYVGGLVIGRKKTKADPVRNAINQVEELLGAGKTKQAADEAEFGLGQLATAMKRVTDPAGELTSAFQRLQEVHVSALQQLPRDPIGLARTLFEHGVKEDEQAFLDAVPAYRDLLGQKGIDELKRLVTSSGKDKKAAKDTQPRLLGMIRSLDPTGRL